MPKPSLAVLIDAENVAPDHYPWLRERVGELGEPIVQRMFGDFSGKQLAGWCVHAVRYGLQPILQLNGGKGKNSTDIALAIDAMDLLHGGKIDGICLVSSDRDFAPLAQRLREGGLLVYGFGRAMTDASLASCCTQFFALPPTVKLSAAPVKPVKAPAPKPPTAKQLIAKAGGRSPPASKSLADPVRIATFLRDLAESKGIDGWLQLSVAATALRAHDPDMASLICGKGKFLKHLRSSEAVDERGSGTAIEIRARPRPPSPDHRVSRARAP